MYLKSDGKKFFLLTATLLEPADRLLSLMKRNIDQFLANEARLQEYLVWVRDKSNSVEADQKIAAIREFYYSLHPSLDHILVTLDTKQQNHLFLNLSQEEHAIYSYCLYSTYFYVSILA